MADRATVVITGASTGIGRACALRLDQAGFQVLAGVRRHEDGNALRAEASARLRTPVLDVTQQATIDDLVDELGDRPLAGLVNNAGIAVAGPLEYVPLDAVRRQLEVNVIGPVAMIQALMPGLRAGVGRIVNVGSVGGRTAAPFVGPYSASKYAIEAVTDSLRQELRPWGMHVAVIEPGSVATPIWDKGRQGADELESALSPQARERYGPALLALGKLTTRLAARGVPPERVAKAVEHALTAPRPRTRYLVGADARVQLGLRAVLPDRIGDAVFARLTGL